MSIADLINSLNHKPYLILSVRVRANADRSSLVSLLSDGSLKISLAAPATDNLANKALLQLLAESFAVPLTNVSILTGQSSRFKTIKIIARH